MTLQEQFSKNLKTVRKLKGLTQAGLAKKSGYSVSLVSMWERGIRSPPLGTVEDAAKALGVSPLALLKE